MHRFWPAFSVILPKIQERKFQSYGACYIPAPAKRYRGGEDAHFIDARTMIVADGVSQWHDEGIDAGLYALDLVNELRAKPIQQVQPSCPGSATMCLAKISGDALDVSNLGDAGVHVYRPGTRDMFQRVVTSEECGYLLVYASKPMRHEDDVPFQLGSHAEADSVGAVVSDKVTVQSGDLVVMGSDGLFDAIPDVSHILSAREFEHPHKLAWQIGTLAAHAAECQGHVDDITVLVARVE